MEIPNYHIPFASERALQIFLEKIVFFYVPQLQKFIFFERLEEAGVVAILKVGPQKDGKLSEEGNIDVYHLADGQIFLADPYQRHGELYQNIDDFVALRSYVFNQT